MKFGITWIRSSGTLKASTVSSLRKPETAVRPSDWRIENRVMALKEGCCPTSVMSVPWSVVTTGSWPSVSSMAPAIQADVAWGIA